MTGRNSEASRRRNVNLVNASVSIAMVLLLAASSSGGSNFLKQWYQIERRLDQAMTSRRPNYTDIYVNVTYHSEQTFNAGSMSGLYNITTKFIELILWDILPEYVLLYEDHRFIVNVVDYWSELLVQYSGLLVICIFLILFAALMPVFGVFFCCCRCCGKCGSRSKPYDKKHDFCRKFLLASLLIVCGTLLLFGVVCAFVTNEHMEEGVQELPTNLRKAVQDANAFLNATNYQIHVLSKVNFKEFSVNVAKTLKNCSNIIYNELEQISNATSMDTISEITEEFPKIRKDYHMLKDATNQLRVYASELNDAVRKIKKDLLSILRGCMDKLDVCQKLNEDISTLQTSIDFNKLPDINEQIKDLEQVISTSDMTAIMQGKKKLHAVKHDIQAAVRENIETAKLKIDSAGLALSKKADEIMNVVDQARHYLVALDKKVDEDSYFDKGEKYLREYNPYRYYTGVGVSCILLSVTVFITLGLICGICGKRPDGYGDDCCNKGSGSQFLICGVIFMFFFTTVIAAVALVYFLVGVVSLKAVCQPLRNPDNSEILEYFNQIEVRIDNIDFNFTEIYKRCRQNQTLYNVLDFDNRIFDFNDHYLDKYDINKTLYELTKTNIDFDGFTLLDQSTINTLMRISRSDFAIVDFDKFQDELNANFTNRDFNGLLREIGHVVGKVHELAVHNGDSNAFQVEEQLKLVREHIIFYQAKLIEPMQKIALHVIETAQRLEIRLHLGQPSFREGMENLIDKVTIAQKTLRDEGHALIKTITENFAQDLLDQIRKYFDRVILKTKNEVGHCAPFVLVLNSTLTSTCDKILLPMNGFWFGLVCSMIVFLPTIIISVKLATLYQKQRPYSSGHSIETSRYSKPHKKKKNKRSDDRSGLVSGEAVPREFSGNVQSETRYSDMAPKTWEDFPAGGPPQYQRAPTEYERPPPYYYPGTTTGENNQ